MDNTSNTTGWVVGIIVVILVVLGLWWFVSAGDNSTQLPAGTTQSGAVDNGTGSTGGTGAGVTASTTVTASSTASTSTQ